MRKVVLVVSSIIMLSVVLSAPASAAPLSTSQQALIQQLVSINQQIGELQSQIKGAKEFRGVLWVVVPLTLVSSMAAIGYAGNLIVSAHSDIDIGTAKGLDALDASLDQIANQNNALLRSSKYAAGGTLGLAGTAVGSVFMYFNKRNINDLQSALEHLIKQNNDAITALSDAQ